MRRLLVCLLATASLATAGGSAAQPLAQHVAAKVVFGLTGDVQGGFNAWLNCCNAVPGAYITVPVLHGAFIENNHGVWVKDLVAAARADARGISYTIRPDAYWYWGGRKVAVTYRDFVYTLREIDDPANDIAGRGGFGNLDPTRFVHHGDREVTFFWRESGCTPEYPCGPYAAWQTLFSQLFPSFALAGQDFNKIWTTCICGSDGKPVADGPFYLASYLPGQIVVLKANPYYYGKAKLAEIDFKILTTDPGVLTEAIRDGQVDAIAPSFAPDFLALRDSPGITYRSAPIYALEHLDIREGSARGAPSVTKGSSNVLLRAPWLRQAIALALDRQAMIDTIYGPNSGLKPDDSLLVYPGEAGYHADFARWNHNPAKAIAILRKHCTGGPAAPDPATTKVWRCAGLPTLIRYAWTSNAPARTLIESIAKANLKAVGIALVERPAPAALLFAADGIPTGDFDLVQYAEFTSGDPGDWYENYRCYGVQNFKGYCSHRVDALLRAANNAFDASKRAALFARADALMAAEVPAIPLFQKPGAVISKAALLGLEPNPGPSGVFWNIQDWRWRR